MLLDTRLALLPGVLRRPRDRRSRRHPVNAVRGPRLHLPAGRRLPAHRPRLLGTTGVPSGASTCCRATRHTGWSPGTGQPDVEEVPDPSRSGPDHPGGAGGVPGSAWSAHPGYEGGRRHRQPRQPGLATGRHRHRRPRPVPARRRRPRRARALHRPRCRQPRAGHQRLGARQVRHRRASVRRLRHPAGRRLRQPPPRRGRGR